MIARAPGGPSSGRSCDKLTVCRDTMALFALPLETADPRLQAAVRTFRSVTRWDAYWVEGSWKEQACFIPLRRGGEVWKLRTKRTPRP